MVRCSKPRPGRVPSVGWYLPPNVANSGTAGNDRSSSVALPLLIFATHHPPSDFNMAEGVPITNTLFPPPPEYYKAFTPEAVERLAELRTKDEGGEERERLEKELDPPRTDWVLVDGRWMAFGQQYTVSTECDAQELHRQSRMTDKSRHCVRRLVAHCVAISCNSCNL